MGIINLTPDSFYPGSRFLDNNGNPDLGRVSSQIFCMLEQGASIIDIGACSSRPGAIACAESEEWRRLEPAIRMISTDFPELLFSVDTSRSTIVERVYDIAGHFIVNDISAGEDDASMLDICGRLGLGYVAMHSRSDSWSMSSLKDYFRDFSCRAEDSGVKDWILDPGFGFGKTEVQNYELLSKLFELKQFGRRILVGISRKSMVYKPLGLSPDNCLSETQVLHFAALQSGADILRVHDVAQARRTIRLWELLNNR